MRRDRTLLLRALGGALPFLLAAGCGGTPEDGAGVRADETPAEFPGDGAGTDSGDGGSGPFPAVAVAERVALLVGVDRHAPVSPDAGPGARAASLPPLAGATEDVLLVRGLLLERFGFREDDVLVLVNERATHAGFLRAFREELLPRTGPETEVLLWYSGHGSRVPDASDVPGAERDGLDSTLVLYDSRSERPDGSFDLSDDELFSLLSALAERTGRITVVTDSCHSGAVLRGTPAAAGARSAPAGTRPLDRERLAEIWPEDIVFLEDGDPRRRVDPPWVHVAACAPTQIAREISLSIGAPDSPPGPDRQASAREPAAGRASGEALPETRGEPRRHHGALTFFLTLALRQAQPGDSWRIVADRAAARLADRFPGQTAWYEGALDRVVMGGSFAPAPRGFRARATGQLVSIQAGGVHGLGVGTVVEVFDVREERALGRAVVRRASALSSLAEWEQAPPAADGAALRAVEVTRAPGIPPLEVVIDDERLAERLADCPWIGIVDVPDGAYRVTASAGVALHSPEGLRLWPREHELPASDVAQTLETPGALDRIASELRTALRDEYRHRTVYRLPENPGSLPVSLAFVPVPRSTLSLYSDDGFVEAGVEPGAASPLEFQVEGGLGRDDKRLAALEVVNGGDAPVHVTVLSVAEDRSLNVVYPPANRRDNRLEPGGRKTVLVQVFVEESWGTVRPMRDRYVAVATPAWADFQPLTRTSPLRGGQAGSLPDVIAAALREPRTRGAGNRPSPSEFGVAAVDLLVRRPARVPEAAPSPDAP